MRTPWCFVGGCLGQFHPALFEDGLGQVEAGGHAGVDDLAYLGVTGERQEHEGVGGVEGRDIGKPIAHHAGGFLDGVGEVDLGGDGVDRIAGIEEGQGQWAAGEDGDADAYLGCDFGAADGDFAVAHDGVDVAKTQVCPFDLNGEVERGAGDDLLGVHVAAVLAGLAGGHGVGGGRGANDADHGAQFNGDVLGEVGLAVADWDDAGALLNRAGKRTEVRVGGHGGVVADLNAEDLHLEGVTRVGAVDGNRTGGGVHLVPADGAEQLRLIRDGVGEAIHGVDCDFVAAFNMQAGFLVGGHSQDALVGIDGMHFLPSLCGKEQLRLTSTLAGNPVVGVADLQVNDFHPGPLFGQVLGGDESVAG